MDPVTPSNEGGESVETAEQVNDRANADAGDGDAAAAQGADGSHAEAREDENKDQGAGEGDGQGDGAGADEAPKPDPEAVKAREDAESAYQKALDNLSSVKSGKLDVGDPKFKDPDYQPDSYEEIVQEAGRRLEAVNGKKQEAEDQLRQAAVALIDAQYAEVKSMGCTLSKDDLVAIADKWGFNDLYKAYDMHRELSATKGKAAAKGAEEAAKRKVESVAAGSAGGHGSDAGMTYDEIHASGSVHDAVDRYLNR